MYIIFTRCSSSKGCVCLYVYACKYICIHTCVYTHMHMYMYTYIHKGTGWRRLIGCLKLQVIVRRRATNYRAFLRKMTYEDEASYDSTPPCVLHGTAAANVFVCGRVRMYKYVTLYIHTYIILTNICTHIYT